ncbi:MAG: HAD-IA family hydrolase [Phycisphaeraceae bacterium]|nr:HAD-IA family hydrolase [Phycisphaeraceae bacterium]
MNLDIDSIRAVSFDCYGTLIDWQAGIAAAVAPLRVGLPQIPAGDALFSNFAKLEREAELPPFCSYKDVLRQVMSGLTGVAGPCELLDTLWRSIADWPAFADVPHSLRRLKVRFGRLAVLSNVDDDLFEASHARLGIRLDEIVTAQRVGSYKPDEGNFRALLATLDLPPSQILHVAESRFHDIEPAAKMGFKTAWVHRQTGQSASGEPTKNDVQPDWHVRSLRELCELVGA